MNLNDLESIPGFLAARAAHFVAYATAHLHDVRATCWTFSSLVVLAMVVYVLLRLI